MNVSIEYLYRDAGNNKLWGCVVFSNKTDSDISALRAQIKGGLIEGEFLVAEDVGLPPLHFDRYDNGLDHGWHEFFSAEKVAAPSNDCLNRDIGDFIVALKLSQLRST